MSEYIYVNLHHCINCGTKLPCVFNCACSLSGCVKSAGKKTHTCPYQKEINGNSELYCDCCEQCIEECRQEI